VNRYAGLAALALGDTRLAVQRFAAAVSLAEAPDNPQTVAEINSCLLGVSFARLGRLTDARKLLGEPCDRYARGSPDSLIMSWIDSARRSVSR